MNLPRILNFASFFFTFLVYVAAGLALAQLCRYERILYDNILPGKPLPTVTELILQYGAHSSAMLSPVLGLMITMPLYFIEQSSAARREYLPFWITICWVPLALEFIVVCLALSMPMLDRIR